MANFFGYAYLTYCTPLIEVRPSTGKSPNIVHLEWEYEDRSAFPDKPYKEFTITRFIGDLYETERPDPSTDSRFKAVTTITWIGSATTKLYDDDLSIYYSDTSRVLSLLYGIDKTDKEILDEIYYTKRPIYYALSTSIQGGGFGAVPYAIEAHTTGWVEARSTKTQVMHNILYEEGDRIWSVNTATQLSRTAVDVNRVYVGASGHAGPTGKGGWVWAAEQFGKKVFKFQLKNGKLDTTYNTPGQGQGGHGVAVDPYTGECLCGTYDYEAEETDNTWKYYLLQPETPHSAVVAQTYACYGLTVWSGHPGWFASSCRTATKIMLISRNGAITHYDNTFFRPYGIACTPQGRILYEDNLDVPLCCHRGICSDSSGTIEHVTYTGEGITIGPHTGQGADDTMGCGVDSEDNLWVCHTDGKMFKGYYALENSTDFPLGGSCRYPSLRLDQWSYSSTSTHEFEWFLTRDPAAIDNVLTATIQGEIKTALGFYNSWTESVKRRVVDGLGADPNSVTGLMVSGSFTPSLSSLFRDKISLWDSIFCDSSKATYNAYNLSGREVYPFFPTTNIPTSDKHQTFANSPDLGDTYMYSDFTGAILIGSIDKVLSNYSLVHPQEQIPSIKLLVEGKYQSQYGLPEDDPLTAAEFSSITHKNERLEYTPLPVAVTGYDNLTVSFSALTIPGTFDKADFTWYFNTKNYPKNINENVANTLLFTQNSEIVPEYTYYDPTMFGLTGNRFAIATDNGLSSITYTSGYMLSGHYRYPSGSFYPVASVDYIVDVYNSAFTQTESLPVEVRVLERWPTAINYVVVYDQPLKRYNWFNCNLSWDKSADIMERDIGYINSPGGNLRTSGRVSWGTDPLTAVIYDMSVSRTWAISSWHWTVTNTDWWNPVHVLSNTITTTDAAIAPYDTLSLIRRLSSYELRYGTHYVSLTVAASGTSTPSINTFTSIISVLEFEPFANFMTVAASTVPAWYSDSNTIALSTIIGYSSATPGFINSGSTIISGYAPNLTIWFRDSSEAHTFPISSYEWNFGDYYDEVNNVYSVSAVPNTLTGVFSAGCWHTQQVNHTAYHTYTMPGFYCVTLTVEASNTQTSDICSKPQNCDGVYIYVQEINPNACFTISNTAYNGPYLSGLNLNVQTITGYTVFYNPSCTIPGSFAICKIDWDFGDNTYLTVSRQAHSGYYYPITAYNNDIWDPRNYVVSHNYTPDYYEPLNSIIVTMSAYACNTNTVSIVTAGIGTISRPTNPYINNESKHLVDTKMFDIENKMYLGYEIENTGLLNIYISSVK